MPASRTVFPSALAPLQGTATAGLLGAISPYDAIMAQRRVTAGPGPGMPLTQEEIAARELATLLFGTPGQNGPSALDAAPMQPDIAELANQALLQTPTDTTMRRSPAMAPEPSGQVALPPAARAAVMANADRVLAEQPGAARHAAEIGERRRLAAEHGTGEYRPTSELEMANAQTLPGAAFLSRLPISNQAPYAKRRKPPEMFRGGLSAAIAGLAPPTGYKAPTPAEPDFESRPENPSLFGRNVAAMMALRNNPEHQAVLAARRAKEDTIRQNIESRRMASNDPIDSLELAPAQLRLLQRQNPALALQARQQAADRASRDAEARSLGDYRNSQVNLDRERMDRADANAKADRDNAITVAEIQANARGNKMSAQDEALLNAEAAKMFDEGRFGDPQTQEARDARDAYIASKKAAATGQGGTANIASPQVSQGAATSMPPQKTSEVEATISEAKSVSAAVAGLNHNADPKTVVSRLRQKFGDVAFQEYIDDLKERRASFDYLPTGESVKSLQDKLDRPDGLNSKLRKVGLEPIDVSKLEVKSRMQLWEENLGYGW